MGWRETPHVDHTSSDNLSAICGAELFSLRWQENTPSDKKCTRGVGGFSGPALGISTWHAPAHPKSLAPLLTVAAEMQERSNYKVYKITCLENGKMYFGITKMSISARMKNTDILQTQASIFL